MALRPACRGVSFANSHHEQVPELVMWIIPRASLCISCSIALTRSRVKVGDPT